jgi:solute carrier family 35 protein E1
VIGIIPSLIEGWYAEDSILDVLNISSVKLPPLIQAMLSHCIYNMVSFSLLGQMTALTYSVGNSIKRLIIIYCSILYFGNPVTHLNMLGSLIAVLGVFIYSYEPELNAKRKPKPTIKVVHV